MAYWYRLGASKETLQGILEKSLKSPPKSPHPIHLKITSKNTSLKLTFAIILLIFLTSSST